MSSERKIILCGDMQWMHCADLQAEDVFSLSGKITINNNGNTLIRTKFLK